MADIVLSGTYNGAIKCTYATVYDSQGQSIFTFSRSGLPSDMSGNLIIAKDIKYNNLTPCLLQPFARQFFLSMCEKYGWYIDAGGTLQEVPDFWNPTVPTKQTITRTYIDEEGNLKTENVTLYKQTVTKLERNSYAGQQHIKFYSMAVKLLPYISGDKTVYVKSDSWRWEKNTSGNSDNTGSSTGTSKTSSSKLLGLLALAATVLTSK